MKKRNHDTAIITGALSIIAAILCAGFIIVPLAYKLGFVGGAVLIVSAIALPGGVLACLYGMFLCEQLGDKRKGDKEWHYQRRRRTLRYSRGQAGSGRR